VLRDENGGMVAIAGTVKVQLVPRSAFLARDLLLSGWADGDLVEASNLKRSF
jgi:hypothetical protein